MKTVTVLVVLVFSFTATKCYPSGLTNETEHDPSDEGSSHFQVFGDEASDLTEETTTEPDDYEVSVFEFQVPFVFHQSSNDTSTNTTKVTKVTDSVPSGHSGASDAKDDAKKPAAPVVKVTYKISPNSGKSRNSSVASNLGDKITDTDSSNDKTVGVDNGSEASTGVAEEEDSDDYDPEIPEFTIEIELSDTTFVGPEDDQQTNTNSTDKTQDTSSFSLSSDTNDSSTGYSSVTSNVHGNPLVSGLSSDFVDGSEGSLHRRAAEEYDSDYVDFENTTDVNVVGSVSSSADNYNSKIYESVYTDISGASFPSSSDADYDPSPQHFASDSGFGASHPVEVPVESNPESVQVEFTTQAAYDEAAVLLQRQRLAELRLKFLENESKLYAEKAVDETETATDFEAESTTERQPLSFLPDAHRAPYY
ncbi:hypothetical protein FHG87_003938 [Trinorchestia longiramus]|nr:hypothetical protein FHG87_003938 [Trinorchestia longiramus]